MSRMHLSQLVNVVLYSLVNIYVHTTLYTTCTQVLSTYNSVYLHVYSISPLMCSNTLKMLLPNNMCNYNN